MSVDMYTQAEAWLAQDPDPETRAELSALLEAARSGEVSAQRDLKAHFTGRLAFGTAGLRGPVQAGPQGMNRVLVAQTARGLADYLLANMSQPSVVIGYDARHKSDVFARDTAEIMQAAGVKAMLLPEQGPTPVLAFAVRHLDASAGVMVTASHNPPQDNGYKVYLGGDDGGAQIVPPADQAIAEAIDAVAASQCVNTLPRSDDYQKLDDQVIEAYIAQTAALRSAPLAPINYVYTAMHGVGCDTFLRTLETAGLAKPTLVSEQCRPDGRFPTVEFPNPEEPGALDLAIAQAKQEGAECIIAHDPDADRLAVAVADEHGVWASLHGNEIGRLLGLAIAQRAQKTGQHGALACSLVSSPALGKIAAHYGLDFHETLTGFKWIGRITHLLFGYEEALGYLVDPKKVHDKDGISAAIVFLDLLLELKAQGRRLADFRHECDQLIGAYASGQVSIRVDQLTKIGELMRGFRSAPPQKIADYAVEEFIDHQQTDRRSNILVFHLDNGARVIIRPSGTEPKVKIYSDAKGETQAEARAVIEQLSKAMQSLLAN
ncbi:phospho-sugar mutase [Suttonella sp. R2A3]|uniref:phospho-sugar mutase n=1 Tax=Suttonella sp. R2A3 TaxID=2908648 RepID=UPI001F30A128|nr:phospho-sugar mutase [Suttonella sp. R2A3]UJF23645.1 phospho-sugar mutase [Suttonella sp. R2A3]